MKFISRQRGQLYVGENLLTYIEFQTKHFKFLLIKHQFLSQ